MSNGGGLELQISLSASKYVSVSGRNVKQDTTNRNSCILCLDNPSMISPRTSYCVHFQTLAASCGPNMVLG